MTSSPSELPGSVLMPPSVRLFPSPLSQPSYIPPLLPDIPIEDLRYILERLTFWPYITSEVIGMANPTPATYTQIGATSVADYFQKLARAFWDGNLASLNGFEHNCMYLT